ncbi:MAG: hypothetical protein R3E79_40220 [Caldilineaceae bacterium]
MLDQIAAADLSDGRDRAEMRGDYGLARTLYESALLLAETANFGATGVDLATLSRVYTYLSVLTLKQGEVDRAIDLIEKAMDCDRRRGDVISPLYDLMNLASAYRKAGRTTEAYQAALNGLHLAERLKHSYLIAGLAATVGEACCDLGRFTEAEQYAMQSLQQEEEYFRSSALVILGLVRQASGQTATAVKLLHEAIVSAQNLDDKYSEAYGWRILGQVYQADQQPLPMGEAYQTAALLYTQLGLPQEVAAIERRIWRTFLSMQDKGLPPIKLHISITINRCLKRFAVIDDKLPQWSKSSQALSGSKQ